MRRLLRLWHTLRWLRPVQFYGRAWFRLARPKPDLRAAPQVRAAATADWTLCERPASMTGPRRFRFLGVERELASAGDWNRADWPKLWLYNAHYFDDLAADGAPERAQWQRRLVERWIAENPPARGNGWEPYPASLRIVNWIKWSLGGGGLEASALDSLAVQVRYLRHRLEIHLLGNHLWANAKALVFAGMFFRGDEADAWREKGLQLLSRELDEQVLPDGGHFERSPMYHCILLEDVLDVLQLASAYPGVIDAGLVTRLRDAAVRMLRWLRVMTHPDGGISFFNDAALGIAPGLQSLEDYARALGLRWSEAPLEPLEVLPDSGYVRLQCGHAVLIADVGEVGPDYLPGHAHADTLSFELSVHGQRVLVNGGTSTYDAGPLRLAQRGTAMHNTVEVDGQDSSEVWSSFRVARRARPKDVHWRADEGGTLVLEAAHDGYVRLPGRVVHSRRWELSRAGLAVVDVVAGEVEEAVARFRFAPGFETAGGEEGAGRGHLVAGDVRVTWWNGDATPALVPGAWYPRFGDEQPCQVLECRFGRGLMSTEFIWT